LVGQLVAGGAFERSFLLMALLHPIAFLLAFLALRSARRSNGEGQLVHA
jgi:ACS family hexuronate transporter-like MFS transporter